MEQTIHAFAASQCPYLFVNHGSTNTSRFYFRLGDSVSVVCDDGYRLEGQAEVTCLEGGEWSHEPQCERVHADPEVTLNMTLIVVVCSVASVVALGVLLFSVYMLCGNVKTEKELAQQEQEKRDMEDMHNLRVFLSVNQDNVGMPAVIYGNINATLRGRPISTSESSEKSSSVPSVSVTQIDIDNTNDFIY